MRRPFPLRRVTAVTLVAATTLLLSGCMGWFQDTAQGPTLIVGKPSVSGNRGQVMISVTGMPQGGLASISVADGGITTTDIKASSIQAEGIHGFAVLAQDFTAPAPQGCLVAANATTGTEGGTLIKITFETTGGNPTFTVTKADVTLGNASNALITTWTLSCNETDYYAKDRKGGSDE